MCLAHNSIKITNEKSETKQTTCVPFENVVSACVGPVANERTCCNTNQSCLCFYTKTEAEIAFVCSESKVQYFDSVRHF